MSISFHREPIPADQGIRNDSTIRIGGVEFTHDGANWLVLVDGQRCRGIEIGGWLVDILKARRKPMNLVIWSGVLFMRKAERKRKLE